MSNNIQPPFQSKKPFHNRNGSDELDVFEAARYFAGATENFSGIHKNDVREAKNLNDSIEKCCMRPTGRMSLDMPKDRGNSIPLQAMLVESPLVINQEKKSKQPSSPGGKLAHFLNSLFNQKSSKKSKLKTTKPTSTKDEDDSLGGWRRKRRSSISHLRSESNSTTTTATTTSASVNIMRDSKSPFSTSTSLGFRTPPPYHIAHTPTKTTSYRDTRRFSDLKPHLTQIAKTPINGNLSKIEHSNIKSDLSEKNMSFGNMFVEKGKLFDEKQDEYHSHKYVSSEAVKEFTRFNDDQDDGDSDSSSDLFELNCDLGYYSSGLPVYETTHMDSIKRCAPISS